MRNKTTLNLLQPTVDPKLKDALGNTALMYAVLNGNPDIVNALTKRLTTSWGFDVFQTKNNLGKTAENVATSNGNVHFACQLKTERMNMLQNMHQQLALAKPMGCDGKGWNGYDQGYKFAKIWRKKSSIGTLKKSTSVCDLPTIFDEKYLDGNYNSVTNIPSFVES